MDSYLGEVLLVLAEYSRRLEVTEGSRFTGQVATSSQEVLDEVLLDLATSGHLGREVAEVIWQFIYLHRSMHLSLRGEMLRIEKEVNDSRN